MVDFCIRALRHDGLRVAPFDRHPAGDGALRDLGLEPRSWSVWLREVVRQVELLDGHLRQPDLGGHRRAIANISRSPDRPRALCPGDRELRARLDELWTAHKPVADAWKRAITGRPRHEIPRIGEARRLWRALEPFRARLPTLRIFLVDYPVPVFMTIPPSTCLIARDATDAERSKYARTLVAAAAELATTEGPARTRVPH